MAIDKTQSLEYKSIPNTYQSVVFVDNTNTTRHNLYCGGGYMIPISFDITTTNMYVSGDTYFNVLCCNDMKSFNYAQLQSNILSTYGNCYVTNSFLLPSNQHEQLNELTSTDIVTHKTVNTVANNTLTKYIKRNLIRTYEISNSNKTLTFNCNSGDTNGFYIITINAAANHSIYAECNGKRSNTASVYNNWLYFNNHDGGYRVAKGNYAGKNVYHIIGTFNIPSNTNSNTIDITTDCSIGSNCLHAMIMTY